MMIGIVDEAAASVWAGGRGDLVSMIESLLSVATANGPLVTSFVGPLALLFGLLGLLGLTVSMLMRSALIYLVAALAPLVWSSSVLPVMRDSSRRLGHLLVALVVSKLAIVISLVVAVQLASNVTAGSGTARAELDAAAAVGQLLTGFACFSWLRCRRSSCTGSCPPSRVRSLRPVWSGDGDGRPRPSLKRR
jgi:hypothetical protein